MPLSQPEVIVLVTALAGAAVLTALAQQTIP